MKNQKSFTRLLMQWHKEENKRVMPWKGEKNPYKVWLSEVILQQTRVEQGWNYYKKFIQKYPSVQELAKAKDEDVFKLWEGLGYYSRCQNLLHTAKIIHEKYQDNFPEDYAAILNLKGIGAYTASAITSFCFDLPFAVVDGNVIRVLARFFGIDISAGSSTGKKFFSQFAQKILDKNKPGDYNQAIMDFGATVCKPANPLCNICPLNKKCVAFDTDRIAELPVKEKSLIKKERWFTYFIFKAENKIFVQQRMQKDIWQNLHEFYLIETSNDPAWNNLKVKKWLNNKFHISSFDSMCIITAKPQILTHQKIHGYFIPVQLPAASIIISQNGSWLTDKEMNVKAFPRFIHQYLQKQFSA